MSSWIKYEQDVLQKERKFLPIPPTSYGGKGFFTAHDNHVLLGAGAVSRMPQASVPMTAPPTLNDTRTKKFYD